MHLCKPVSAQQQLSKLGITLVSSVWQQKLAPCGATKIYAGQTVWRLANEEQCDASQNSIHIYQ